MGISIKATFNTINTEVRGKWSGRITLSMRVVSIKGYFMVMGLMSNPMALCIWGTGVMGRDLAMGSYPMRNITRRQISFWMKSAKKTTKTTLTS